jgi:6-phosphogluconolactonase
VNVYVACARDNEILVFTLDPENGTLESVQRVALTGGVTPLAISPDRRFAYAGLRTESPAVAAFAVTAETGLLTPLAITPLPDAPMYLATDATGRYLLCASYAGASFSINPICADGSVERKPVQRTTTPPRAHSIITDAHNRFAFVAALGGDVILQYAFDAATGRATPNAVPWVRLPGGSGPRHMVFHPRLDLLFVNGELDGRVYAFAYDRMTGRLRLCDSASMLPRPLGGASWAAELATSPDGRFLYASERRTGTIALFDLHRDPRRLSRLDVFATEAQPRALAIDPLGRWLLVAGETTNYLGVCAIDAATGKLVPHHRYAVGDKPVWIAIADLARPRTDRSPSGRYVH